MSMRLAANISLMFTEVPLLQRFMAAKQAGFNTVEIQFPYVERIEDLVSAKNEADVEVCLINVPAGDLMTGGEGLACVPGKESEFELAITQCCQYAEALDVNVVNVLPGKCMDEDSRSDYLATFRCNLKKAAEVFSAHNILVTFEAVNTQDMPGFLVHNSEQMHKIMMDVDHSNLKMQFDIYHMQIMEGHVDKTIKKYSDLIGHIQFADTPNRGEPLSGDLNFVEIFNSIRLSDYRGHVSAEYRPTVKTENSLKWMKELDLQWLN